MYLPSKLTDAALADRIIGALVVVFQEELRFMSQQLTDKLSELGTKEDQVISILNTESSTIKSLQDANDLLRAQQGDDSAQVAAVQGLIDKLTVAITPVPDPAPVAVPDPAPVAPVVEG